MLRNRISTAFIAAAAASTLVSAPALAQDYRFSNDVPAQARNVQYADFNGYDRGYDDRAQDDRRYEGGYRCKKGTTGMLVGAVAGGLLGRAIAGRYRGRTTGTILGAGAGALAGRALERSGGRGC